MRKIVFQLPLEQLTLNLPTHVTCANCAARFRIGTGMEIDAFPLESTVIPSKRKLGQAPKPLGLGFLELFAE